MFKSQRQQPAKLPVHILRNDGTALKILNAARKMEKFISIAFVFIIPPGAAGFLKFQTLGIMRFVNC